MSGSHDISKFNVGIIVPSIMVRFDAGDETFGIFRFATASRPPLPQYVFMAWYLVKNRDNFNFY